MSAANAKYGRLPVDVEISEASQGSSGQTRYRVMNPQGGGVCILGEKELRVAKLFNGDRSIADIQKIITEQENSFISIENLVNFEQRLRKYGLIYDDSTDHTNLTRDPFTGMTYGVLQPLIVVKLISFDPTKILEKTSRWLSSPFSRWLALIAAAIIVAALRILLSHWNIYLEAVNNTLHGWNWIVLYLLIAFSSIFHEGGHAIMCKAYGVRINQVGLATYYFMPTGWARPHQGEWDQLSKQKKLITIFAGPLGSVLFGALGIILWYYSDGYFASLGVIVSITTIFGVIPTLLPFLNGDGYLMLTVILDTPNIRLKSFAYLKSKIQRTAMKNVDAGHSQLYLAISIGIIIGWIIWWSLIAICIAKVVGREITF